MITSVTSATLTATSAAGEWAVALGSGGALLVIAMLMMLESLRATDGPASRTVQRLLHVATGPLLVVFVVGIASRLVTILANG